MFCVTHIGYSVHLDANNARITKNIFHFRESFESYRLTRIVPYTKKIRSLYRNIATGCPA